MGAFEYTAVDDRGRETRGVLEGDTARQVRQLLRERELLPLAVAEVKQSEERSAGGGRPLRRRINAQELALFTRQLATLVRSALPLEEALLAVAEQNERPRVKSIVLGVRARVMEGHSLADGLADFPGAFPEIYRATVSAGEQSGHLDAVLDRLADFTESRQALRQRISHALIYPIILVSMSLLIIIGMMVYVVPKVVGVFQNTGNELPWLTRGLIALSDFVQTQGWWVALLCIAAVLIWRRLLRRERVRMRWHRLLLRLPLISRLVRGLNTARFTRTFSILAGSGVPVLEALRISGEVVANLPMRRAVEEAAMRIREGSAIARSLAASRLFPPMAIHLISSGEASGQLETMLERAADNQEREMDSLISALLAAMEPALIVFMGLTVFTIVMAILLPIFELNQLVGR